MEQAKALNALEPFLALTKAATSPRAAVDLVARATSAPNTFLFTELLETPQIQALSSAPSEFAPYLTLLQIFSYGTYSSYTSTANLPPLNDTQKLKLRQLSLLTIARTPNHDDTTPSAVSYPSLIASLGLSSSRELEELVISTIYAGLVDAQLDPKHQQVLINSVAPLRDVAPASVGGLLSSLRAWAGRCDATLQSLEEQMAQVRAEADRRAAESAAWQGKMERLVEDEEKGGAAPGHNSNSHHNHTSGEQHGAPTDSTHHHPQTSSMLTVGALSFPGGGGAGGSGSSTTSGRQPFSSVPGSLGGGAGNNSGGSGGSHALRSKRGAPFRGEDGEVDDEAMDLDDEDEKRASKRKL